MCRWLPARSPQGIPANPLGSPWVLAGVFFGQRSAGDCRVSVRSLLDVRKVTQWNLAGCHPDSTHRFGVPSLRRDSHKPPSSNGAVSGQRSSGDIVYCVFLYKGIVLRLLTSVQSHPAACRMAAQGPDLGQRLIPPHHVRFAYLQHQYAIARQCHNMVLGALVPEEERVARLECCHCRWWVRPWLLSHPAYGHFENVMVELEREHHGDFKGFLRMEPNMFHDLVQCVGPWIENSQE